MTDDPFHAPGRAPRSPRQPPPGELRFEFVRESDHAPFRCEVRNPGEWGVETQFLINGDLLVSRLFQTTKLAVQWAELEWTALQKGEDG
jgi:hypothetical protein